jgi:translation elongation factor P/translation initiation factor 5A
MTEAKELRKGAYIKFNNEVLRVTKKEIVAFGTHSHSKTKLFVQSLNSKGEKSINLNHHDQVEELDIIRKSAQVISKGDDKLQIMDSQSFETIDADAEPEVLNEVNEGDEVTFIEVEGNAKVLEKR